MDPDSGRALAEGLTRSDVHDTRPVPAVPGRIAAEAAFSRSKRVLGGALRSRGLEAQRARATIAVRALNRMAELGMPRARRVA